MRRDRLALGMEQFHLRAKVLRTMAADGWGSDQVGDVLHQELQLFGIVRRSPSSVSPSSDSRSVVARRLPLRSTRLAVPSVALLASEFLQTVAEVFASPAHLKAASFWCVLSIPSRATGSIPVRILSTLGHDLVKVNSITSRT